jgi:dihydropteroate synthase
MVRLHSVPAGSARRLAYRDKVLELGKRTLVMGILNVTPDSFSDGGKYTTIDKALKRAQEMVEEGADIIDVGGESTRPGHQPVPAEEELKRVIPVIEALAREVDVPISVDTYKAEVARQALEAGAHIINDVWGLKMDPDMASVAARYGCPVIIMHNRTSTEYRDLVSDVVRELRACVAVARQAGVADEQIILDPGIGFGKTLEQNLQLMNHLRDIVSIGYPVLLGTSRKSMIQKTLNQPPGSVLGGTAATVALGIMQGCHIVRVHDVAVMKQVAVMTDAILQSGR